MCVSFADEIKIIKEAGDIMGIVWNILSEKICEKNILMKLFLTVNVLIWSAIGYLLWFSVHYFALNSIDWALCFAGYPGILIGFIGGVIYLWNRN